MAFEVTVGSAFENVANQKPVSSSCIEISIDLFSVEH